MAAGTGMYIKLYKCLPFNCCLTLQCTKNWGNNYNLCIFKTHLSGVSLFYHSHGNSSQIFHTIVITELFLALCLPARKIASRNPEHVRSTFNTIKKTMDLRPSVETILCLWKIKASWLQLKHRKNSWNIYVNMIGLVLFINTPGT